MSGLGPKGRPTAEQKECLHYFEKQAIDHFDAADQRSGGVNRNPGQGGGGSKYGYDFKQCVNDDYDSEDDALQRMFAQLRH